MTFPRSSRVAYATATARQIAGILKTYSALLGNRFPAYALLAFTILLGAGLDSLGIALVMPFVAALQGQDPSAFDLSGLFSRFEAPPLVVIATLLGAVYLLKNALALARTRLSLNLLYETWQSWIESIVDNILRAPVATYQSEKPGTLLSVALTQTTETTVGLRQVLELAVSLATLTATYLVLWVLSWQATLVITIALLLFALGMLRPLSRIAHRAGALFVTASKNASSTFLELLNGIRYVKAYGQEERIETRMRASLDDLKASLVSATWAGTLVHPLIETVVVLMFCAATVLLASRSNEMSRELPLLGVLVAAAFRLFPIVSGLGGQWVAFISKQSSAEAVLGAIRPQPPEPTGSKPFRGLSSAIVLDRVSYVYAGRPAALSDVSLELVRGSRTALVGESGSGKSTVVSLLLGFLQPHAGEVFIDGTPLSELSLPEWRARVGYVGQEGFVFNGTLGENVLLGRTSPDDPRVDEVFQATGLGSIVNELPHGLETLVGERGVELSGGQRQRVAIARAILLRPDVLILDEATSALDNEAAHQVMQGVSRVLPEATVLAVAHRLYSTSRFDRIYVLRAGKVVESGTHPELMSLDGYYVRLISHERMPEPTSR